MIEYLCIRDANKIIQEYLQGPIRRLEVDRIMKRFDIEAPVGNKTINCWKVGRYFAYYFTQSTYTFLLLTQEDKVQMRKTQRRLRINKYLNTIAEMFYEEYDEDNFKKVLKYAVKEINQAEMGIESSSISMSDEADNLVGNEIEGKLRQQRPNFRRRGISRANVITIILFTLLMILMYIYLRAH